MGLVLKNTEVLQGKKRLRRGEGSQFGIKSYQGAEGENSRPGTWPAAEVQIAHLRKRKKGFLKRNMCQ